MLTQPTETREANQRLRERAGAVGALGRRPLALSAITSTIIVGTFVLGMYDPAAKKLVWIGAAQHTIDPNKKQEKNQERLNKGAQKLLKDLPAGRANKSSDS